MTRQRIGSLVLRAYPSSVRRARGPEMLSMLLDAGDQSRLAFTRECGSLLICGLRERSGSRGLRVLAAAGMIVAVLGVGAIALDLTTSGHAQNESNMRSLVGQVMTHLHPGDLVLVTEPGQTSLAHKYLPKGMRYATPRGLDNHPSAAFQHIYSRLVDSYSRSDVERLLATLLPGQHVLLIRGLLASAEAWSGSETAIARRRAAQLAELLAQDPKLRVVAWAPRRYAGACCVSDSALLYVQS